MEHRYHDFTMATDRKKKSPAYGTPVNVATLSLSELQPVGETKEVPKRSFLKNFLETVWRFSI